MSKDTVTINASTEVIKRTLRKDELKISVDVTFSHENVQYSITGTKTVKKGTDAEKEIGGTYKMLCNSNIKNYVDVKRIINLFDESSEGQEEKINDKETEILDIPQEAAHIENNEGNKTVFSIIDIKTKIIAGLLEKIGYKDLKRNGETLKYSATGASNDMSDMLDGLGNFGFGLFDAGNHVGEDGYFTKDTLRTSVSSYNTSPSTSAGSKKSRASTSVEGAGEKLDGESTHSSEAVRYN